MTTPPRHSGGGPVRTSTEPETYPDPPRSWGRSGSLLAGWAVVLATVLGSGYALQAVAPAGAGPDAGTEAVDDRTAVRLFFGAIYDSPNMDIVDRHKCDDYSGPDPAELLAELDDGPFDNDINIDGSEGSGSFIVSIRLYDGAPFQTRTYAVAAADDGASSCVSTVQQVP